MYAGLPGKLRILGGRRSRRFGYCEVDTGRGQCRRSCYPQVYLYSDADYPKGNLKFTVPGGWSPPQTDDPSQPGYTEATGSGIGTAADDNALCLSPCLSLLLTTGDTIVITYGLGSDKAIATTVDGDPDTFTIQIEGTKGSGYQPIGRSPAVTVQTPSSGQRYGYCFGDSGRGWQNDLYAGEESRQIVVVYTAAGQMVASQISLTLPAVADGWSPASADHVTVTLLLVL